MNDAKLERYKELTELHKSNCRLYANYLDSLNYELNSLGSLPFLPVRVFKDFKLFSVPRDEVYKVMLSSGTTGKQSQIFLDRNTSKLQTRGLMESFKEYFGSGRFPMLVIDSESTAKGRTARTAAVNGFAMFAKKRFFALDDDMQLKFDGIYNFLEENKGEKVLIFGFTFIIYQYLFKALEDNSLYLDMSNCFILHGGGWKKLVSLNVSDKQFKEGILKYTQCNSIHNYYGMIEQTGTIYFECEKGRLHAPSNGDVIIRNFDTLEPNGYRQEGVIQVLSVIQESYPGHSLLTEDVGTIYPASDCSCGRNGDILNISGRLKSAEIRGCSDAV